MTAPTRRPPDRPVREPIRQPWIWVAIGLSVLLGVPFYLRVGAIDPVWFGVPFWLVLAIVGGLALSTVLCVTCLRCWSLAEPHELDAAEGGSDAPAEGGER